MIAIVNTTDITGIELDSDWSILEYDSNNVDGSSLAAIEYTTNPPEFNIQLLTTEQFTQFKTTAIWKSDL